MSAAQPSRPLYDVRGSQASNHLDMLRGIAAIAVLVCHAKILFFGTVADDAQATVFRRGLDMLGRYGHSAVIVFFVLSGFFISGSIIRDVAERRWSWRKYLVNRASRLYVVLVPGLLLTLAWDQAGMAFLGQSPPPAAPAAEEIVSANQIREHTTVGALAGNLLFLQTIATPTFGSNGSLWSLANEWWYYILFPCLWLAWQRTASWSARAGYLALAAGVAWMVGTEIASYFAIWLMGTAICLLPRCPWLAGPRASRTASWLAAAPLLLMLAAIGMHWLNHGRLRDGMLGLTFASLIYCLLHRVEPDRGGRYARLAQCLAGFSYTLYVVHFPVLAFAWVLWTYQAPWPADLLHVFYVSGILATVLAYAYALSRLTETQTDHVRRFLMRPQIVFGSRAAPAMGAVPTPHPSPLATAPLAPASSPVVSGQQQ
ncbi:MAG TPA: acyltransferase [Pirellulales bacterium]|nr:acyltransferase [Pirellulales bacterium]